MEVYDLSKENELDTYISRKVPVPIQFHTEMRLKALHKKNLIKVKKIIVD